MAAVVGLCPMLAGADSLVTGIGLGAATLLVLTASVAIVNATRHVLMPSIRLPACLLIITTVVTLLDLLSRAFLFEWRLEVGAALAMIATNCAILARTQRLAWHQPVGGNGPSVLREGLRFALVLVVIGALRELLGDGTLLEGARDVLGERLALPVLRPMTGLGTIALAAVPAGAFFALALLLVAWRAAATPDQPR